MRGTEKKQGKYAKSKVGGIQITRPNPHLRVAECRKNEKQGRGGLGSLGGAVGERRGARGVYQCDLKKGGDNPPYGGDQVGLGRPGRYHVTPRAWRWGGGEKRKSDEQNG